MDRALGLKLSTNRNHSSFDEGENSLWSSIWLLAYKIHNTSID